MRASEAIGTIIRNAIVFNVKNWGNRSIPNSDILATTVITFQDRQIPCVTVEGLLLLKLYTLPLLYQQGNFARVNLYESDIASLLFSYRSATAPLFTVLQKYLSASDLQSVIEIVAEIETRITRFQNMPRSE